MADARWISPFPYTIAFRLFKQHFTELNNIYWSFVPVDSTIKKTAKSALQANDADPKTFFLVRDEDDRRIAPTYGEWKQHFSDFSNYTRLNMIMLLNSCFETYLRTVLALSFESKPGVIIGCPEAVDGVFLLKNDSTYGNAADPNYRFSRQIQDICSGEWSKRFSILQKYFGILPDDITNKESALDEFRRKRNNIGHFFGREKHEYTAPLRFSPEEVMHVSHNKLLEYFQLINNVASNIDKFFHKNYVGSYDIIKLYFDLLGNGVISVTQPGNRAIELKKNLGTEGVYRASKVYYREIVAYCDLTDSRDPCRYSAKACIAEINRQLQLKGIVLAHDGHIIAFKKMLFSRVIKAKQWRDNLDYCRINQANPTQKEYRYSSRVIDGIVCDIENNPEIFIKEYYVQSKNDVDDEHPQ